MRKALKIIAELTCEALCSIVYFVKNNLMAFANILNIIVPYAMYFIGQYALTGKIKLIFGVELFIPLICGILIFYMKSTANKIGKGTIVPVPNKRFTQIDDYGEVSVENRRIQELILYMADLEDYLERRGML